MNSFLLKRKHFTEVIEQIFDNIIEREGTFISGSMTKEYINQLTYHHLLANFSKKSLEGTKFIQAMINTIAFAEWKM